MTTSELELLQGTLNVLLLRARSWHPMHGYAIARFILDGSGEQLRILDGALKEETAWWAKYVAAVAGVMQARPERA